MQQLMIHEYFKTLNPSSQLLHLVFNQQNSFDERQIFAKFHKSTVNLNKDI